jgi:coenzyme Q-binding protein COQ10
MTHITRAVTIDAPLEEVHTAARDPHHWTEWIVGLADRGAVGGTGEMGSFGEFGMLFAGLHLPIRMEVLEDTHSPDGCFCKTAMTGSGVSALSNVTYTPVDGKTHVTFEMDYELPGSVFGKIADRLLVEAMQEHSLEHSASNLKLLVEAKRPALVG